MTKWKEWIIFTNLNWLHLHSVYMRTNNGTLININRTFWLFFFFLIPCAISKQNFQASRIYKSDVFSSVFLLMNLSYSFVDIPFISSLLLYSIIITHNLSCKNAARCSICFLQIFVSIFNLLSFCSELGLHEYLIKLQEEYSPR